MKENKRTWEEETEWLNQLFDLKLAAEQKDMRKVADMTGLPYEDLKFACDWINTPPKDEEEDLDEPPGFKEYESAVIRLIKALRKDHSAWSIDDANMFICSLVGTSMPLIGYSDEELGG